MSAPSLRAELGLSTDQFYRRVRVLLDSGLISPERGVKNKILLTETDAAVLRQFRAIEQMNQEHGLEWCLERLRYELEVANRSELEARAAQLEDSLDFAHTEVRQLRLALAKRTRNPLRRFLAWVRREIRRGEASQSSDR
jgi:hypothetical protein